MRVLAETILRAAFRGRTLRRRLPARFGRAVVYVAPDASLGFLKPGQAAWDANLLRWATEFVGPDDVVWDIGANVGVFTFAAAARGADVLAVEPDPFTVSALNQSAAANPGLRVRIIQTAISDQPGQALLQIAGGGRAANSLAGLPHLGELMGGVVGQVEVQTIPLDELLAVSRPTLVKIDIERAEAVALAGASRLLSECRPTILIEVGDECTDDVGDILHRHDYQLFNANQLGRRPVDAPSYNTLAIPF